MSDNIISDDEQLPPSADFTVRIFNNTKHSLFLKQKSLENGGYWYVEPPNLIKPYTGAYFTNIQVGSIDLRGRVTYLISEGSFEIFWSRKYPSDEINYDVSQFDPQNEYDIIVAKEPKLLIVNTIESK